MCAVPRRRRRPSGPGWLRQSATPPDPWAGENPGPGVCPVAGPLSFWRLVPGPFAAWLAALDRWQLTGHDGRLRVGRSVLRGPVGHDPRFGTCRVEVRLARARLRPRVRMQLHLDHWSATATAVELIPCGHVRPSAAYFRAGRALLDTLTGAVAASPPVPRWAGPAPHQPPADPAEPRTATPGSPAAGPTAIPARQKA